MQNLRSWNYINCHPEGSDLTCPADGARRTSALQDAIRTHGLRCNFTACSRTPSARQTQRACRLRRWVVAEPLHRPAQLLDDERPLVCRELAVAVMDGSLVEAGRGLRVVETQRLEEQPTLARPILGQLLQAHFDQPRVLEIEHIA